MDLGAYLAVSGVEQEPEKTMGNALHHVCNAVLLTAHYKIRVL